MRKGCVHVAKDDMEIVSAIRERLADKVGIERFELWFGASVLWSCKEDELHIEASSDFLVDRIRKNFRGDLEASCREATGRIYNLRFSSRGEDRLKKRPRRNNPGRHQATSAQGTAHGSNGSNKVNAANGQITAPNFAVGLESFVQGSCNTVAFTAANSVVSNLGRYSPMFISGPHGSGKTHLLNCLRQSARRSLNSARVVMMSAEQFTSLFLEALHGSGLPNFRRKYRELDVLIIDDVQFFAGKRATLLELHQTVDSMLRRGRQLVFAADRPINELHLLGDEFANRVSGGLTCQLDPLDQPTRRRVLDELVHVRGIEVPAEVRDAISEHLGGDARQLVGALNRLEVAALAHGRTITADFAAEQLQQLFHSQRRAVQLDDIEKAVCSVFGLDDRSLQSGSKQRAVLQPRMLAMWLARKHTRAAFSEIGRYFGKRSHSTVISANRKVEQWIHDGAPLTSPGGECSAADAVQRIEDRLRASG